MFPPAAWREDLVQVTSANTRKSTAEEQKHLRRLDDAVIASLRTEDEELIMVATTADQQSAVLSPFAATPAHA